MRSNGKRLLLLSSMVAFGSLSFAQMDADNSKVNERDRSAKEITADQQKSNSSDIEITSRIRQDIMKEKNLSTYAQNIKIITVNGKVTLKGPVRSKAEQNRILNYARSVAGSSNVVNEIEITPKKTN